MSDEAKLSKQRDRGARAARILESEIVQEAFAEIEKTILEAWKGSRADDEQGRYNAYLMQRLLQNFRAQFELALSTGKVAEKELLRIHDKSKIRSIFNV